MIRVLVVVATIVLSGCSSRAVYDNIQINKRNQCAKYPPTSTQYQECMKGVDKSYEQYQRDLDEYKKQKTAEDVQPESSGE